MVKNLRVCDDYHVVTALISKMERRTVLSVVTGFSKRTTVVYLSQGGWAGWLGCLQEEIFQEDYKRGRRHGQVKKASLMERNPGTLL